MADFFDSKDLVADIPVTRAAYSDRTAWLMAEMSRLVYEPIPEEISVEELVEDMRAAIQRGDYESELSALVKGTLRPSGKDYQLIPRELRGADFTLLKTFAKGDTEAFLAMMSAEGRSQYLVLAFRGTESVQDAYTDVKAVLVPHPDGGRVHKGFYEAYNLVKKEIEEELAKHQGLPLYITGHSLGGALAMLATKHIGKNNTGATYTFGAPRAADDDFYKEIKTPIYRIVNAADSVPRVPFGYGLQIPIAILRLIPLNGTKKIAEMLRKYVSGYSHEGHMIFMNAPDPKADDAGIPFAELKVEASPNYFWRAWVVGKQVLKTAGKAFVEDHFMLGYSAKLLANALRRR